MTSISAMLVFVVAVFRESDRASFVSVETNFVERSQSGLGIIPASCASSPYYYHYHLFAALGDNARAFSSNNNETEFGGMVGTVPLCITNTSGYNLYVPANTPAELDSFRAGAVPGVSVW